MLSLKKHQQNLVRNIKKKKNSEKKIKEIGMENEQHVNAVFILSL